MFVTSHVLESLKKCICESRFQVAKLACEKRSLDRRVMSQIVQRPVESELASNDRLTSSSSVSHTW